MSAEKKFKTIEVHGRERSLVLASDSNGWKYNNPVARMGAEVPVKIYTRDLHLAHDESGKVYCVEQLLDEIVSLRKEVDELKNGPNLLEEIAALRKAVDSIVVPK